MSVVITSRSSVKNDPKIIPIYVCRPKGWEAVQNELTPAQQTFAEVRGFKGEAEQRVQLPGPDGSIDKVLFGAGASEKDVLGGIRAGALSRSLPQAHYEWMVLPDDWSETLAATGWGLGAYKFENYLDVKKEFPVLVSSDAVDADEINAIVASISLGRDMINIPAGDMGPVAMEQTARDVADEMGASVHVTEGEDLIKNNYPMIHAVGRAAHEAPRLIELEWGDPTHPKLAIVGKGITFDTGGLNIKSANSARLMKKDMGGAAHALALSRMIMANKLPIRLHVLLAVAENAISAGAYRPGDILQTRRGHTVEIDNTDAEGRLVLGDALCKATEDEPKLIIDFATLTGAARVALGPTLPPFFCNRDQPVPGVLEWGEQVSDPMWHMPLWQPYMSMLKSPIATMKNSGGGFAGCITAALFLEQFVDNQPWMHFDVYGWNPSSSAGHPVGGDTFALRALYGWLKSGGLESDFSA